nr:MAG TPA: hypothetical protein [Caudoviricetes sp.]
MFNQSINIPSCFFQILYAVFTLPPPQIFNSVRRTYGFQPLQVNRSRRQRVDALNTALGVVLGMVYIVSHYLCPLIHFSCLAAVPAVAKFFKLACRFASSNLYCSVFHSLNALQIAWQPIFLTSHPLQGDLPTIFFAHLFLYQSAGFMRPPCNLCFVIAAEGKACRADGDNVSRAEVVAVTAAVLLPAHLAFTFHLLTSKTILHKKSLYWPT